MVILHWYYNVTFWGHWGHFNCKTKIKFSSNSSVQHLRKRYSRDTKDKVCFGNITEKILHENAINNRSFIPLSYTGNAEKKLNFKNYQIRVGNHYRSILFDFI